MSEFIKGFRLFYQIIYESITEDLLIILGVYFAVVILMATIVLFVLGVDILIHQFTE